VQQEAYDEMKTFREKEATKLQQKKKKQKMFN
jgi:hypothetical protein